MNCGRCGRPMYKAGEVICEFCRKTVIKTTTRHAEKMNQRKEQEEELFQTIAAPGKDEPTTKEDMMYEHFTDTHDASAVWADSDPKKRQGSRKA